MKKLNKCDPITVLSLTNVSFPQRSEEAGTMHREKHSPPPLEVTQPSPSGSILCLVKFYDCISLLSLPSHHTTDWMA